MNTTEIEGKMCTNLSTKEIIEKNAIALFSEKGYDATSMREIAEASSVTKPVIYYYFKSKESLCHHLIQSGLDDFQQGLRCVCEAEADDLESQIVRMVQHHFDCCKENVEFMRFLYSILFGPDRKKISFDFFAYAMENFVMEEALMRRASAAGVVEEGKEETAVHYLRGIVNTYIMLYVDGRLTFPEGLARTIVADMLNGLGPSRSTDKR